MELLVKKHSSRGPIAYVCGPTQIEEETGLVLEPEGGWIAFSSEEARPAEGTVIQTKASLVLVNGWWKRAS